MENHLLDIIYFAAKHIEESKGDVQMFGKNVATRDQVDLINILRKKLEERLEEIEEELESNYIGDTFAAMISNNRLPEEISEAMYDAAMRKTFDNEQAKKFQKLLYNCLMQC